MLKVTVEEGSEVAQTVEVDRSGGDWKIASEVFGGSIEALGDHRYHVLWKNRSYSIEVIDSDQLAKTFEILINGRAYTTSVKTELDQVLERLGISQPASSAKINSVKAPMPGLIQSIGIKPGEAVSKGDSLLVLVAMKMENVIKASGDGIVKTLMVEAGQSVEKNQLLLEFE